MNLVDLSKFDSRGGLLECSMAKGADLICSICHIKSIDRWPFCIVESLMRRRKPCHSNERIYNISVENFSSYDNSILRFETPTDSPTFLFAASVSPIMAFAKPALPIKKREVGGLHASPPGYPHHSEPRGLATYCREPLRTAVHIPV